MMDPTFQMQVGACDILGRFFDLDSDADISLPEASAFLSEEELARAERFKFDIHRDRFIRGRGFLRQALAAGLGRADPSALTFTLGPQGKPSLDGEGLHFNLSHSEGDAVLATSRDGPVGIDIERHDRNTDVMSLAPSVFTPAECDELASQPDAASRHRFFFLLWTAKEARMKLTGEGMSLNPKGISLEMQDGIPIGCAIPATPEIAFGYVSGLEGASCAVAAPRQV